MRGISTFSFWAEDSEGRDFEVCFEAHPAEYEGGAQFAPPYLSITDINGLSEGQEWPDGWIPRMLEDACFEHLRNLPNKEDYYD